MNLVFISSNNTKLYMTLMLFMSLYMSHRIRFQLLHSFSCEMKFDVFITNNIFLLSVELELLLLFIYDFSIKIKGKISSFIVYVRERAKKIHGILLLQELFTFTFILIVAYKLLFRGNCKPIIFTFSSFSMPQSHVSVINTLKKEVRGEKIRGKCYKSRFGGNDDNSERWLRVGVQMSSWMAS